LTVSIIRSEDLLHLTFDFINIRINIATSQPPTLKRIDEGKPAFVIVNFPPQHVGEQAFFVNDDGNFPLGKKDPEYVPPPLLPQTV